jgi:hypothetical protein
MSDKKRSIRFRSFVLGKIVSSEKNFAFLRQSAAIAKILYIKNTFAIQLKTGSTVVLTYGVSFEELHGALEEVGEHPLVHDGPRPRS